MKKLMRVRKLVPVYVVCCDVCKKRIGKHKIKIISYKLEKGIRDRRQWCSIKSTVLCKKCSKHLGV